KEIIKKFKFKDSGIVLNAPLTLKEEFEKLGFKTNFDNKVKNANTLVFIYDNKAYLNFLEASLKNIEYDSVLWFAYPKGTSKIKTDINRDTIRVTGEAFGITTVTAISIDETWSALRFRPIEKVGK
ncbi:hypothetical protein, partial [Parasediminibacterium sp. JCM 36343]|uniref:hypothetical protein n=1 Tax=Parasediminibacterium sp. JCM 36343 TaxID=3374279 RepID=UPI00397C9802